MTLQEKHETPAAATRPTSALGNQTHTLLSITNKQTLLESLPLSSINIHGNKNVQNCREQNVIYFSFWESAQIPSPAPLPSLTHPPSLPCCLFAPCCSSVAQSATAAKRQKTCADLQQKACFCLLCRRQEHNRTELRKAARVRQLQDEFIWWEWTAENKTVLSK